MVWNVRYQKNRCIVEVVVAAVVRDPLQCVALDPRLDRQSDIEREDTVPESGQRVAQI